MVPLPSLLLLSYIVKVSSFVVSITPVRSRLLNHPPLVESIYSNNQQQEPTDDITDDEDASSLALNNNNNNKSSGFQRFADRLFEKADVNKDGSLDLNETYEMVLKLYVKLNRKAPIPPPSRDKVEKFFQSADRNCDDRISRQEFNQLARILGRRALTRLVAHRVVTLSGAPLLATVVVAQLQGRVWLHNLAKSAIVPDRLRPVVSSASFWRTALIVVFVASLGNIVLGCVNFILDAGYRKDKDEKITSEKTE